MIQIASAKPAIDDKPPPERPHVNYKKKKALLEERRQVKVVQENLRLLDRTINIMAPTDMVTHFSKARTFAVEDKGLQGESSDATGEGDSAGNGTLAKTITRKRTSASSKYFERPLTTRLKRNTHIIFHWFIQRFGRYVPWWAEINY